MAKPPVKDKPDAIQAAPQVPSPTSFDMTLDDYCVEKSRTTRRPELIAAFHASETRAGNVTGLQSELEARFDAFCNRPA